MELNGSWVGEIGHAGRGKLIQPATRRIGRARHKRSMLNVLSEATIR